MTSSATENPTTTSAATPPPSGPTTGSAARRWPSWALVLGSLVVSAGISVVALVTATGPVYLGESSYDTSYAYAGPSWSLAWALPLLPAVIAWSRLRVALWAGAAVVLPQLVTAGIVVHGYIAGGWGSGLEFFAFLMPIALGVVSAGLVGLVALVRLALTRR